MKVSDLKNIGIKFKLNDKGYELKFNMNTFCELKEVNVFIENIFKALAWTK